MASYGLARSRLYRCSCALPLKTMALSNDESGEIVTYPFITDLIVELS
jgi:hypothetical protein